MGKKQTAVDTQKQKTKNKKNKQKEPSKTEPNGAAIKAKTNKCQTAKSTNAPKQLNCPPAIRQSNIK